MALIGSPQEVKQAMKMVASFGISTKEIGENVGTMRRRLAALNKGPRKPARIIDEGRYHTLTPERNPNKAVDPI